MKKSQTQRKGGRPSKYQEKYVDDLIEHFESYLREPFTKEVIRRRTTYKGKNKVVDEEYKLVSKAFPSLFAFARKIGVEYFTVYRWATDRVGEKPVEGEDTRPFLHPAFCDAYKSRQEYQSEFLSQVGLGGIAPAAAFIFTAKNVLNWRDTTDQRFLDKDGNAVTPGYIILPRLLEADQLEKEYAGKI